MTREELINAALVLLIWQQRLVNARSRSAEACSRNQSLRARFPRKTKGIRLASWVAANRRPSSLLENISC